MTLCVYHAVFQWNDLWSFAEMILVVSCILHYFGTFANLGQLLSEQWGYSCFE